MPTVLGNDNFPWSLATLYVVMLCCNRRCRCRRLVLVLVLVLVMALVLVLVAPSLSYPPPPPPPPPPAAKDPDAKRHAVVQMAVIALNKAGGDLEHIGESSTLQDALLAALKRARLLRQEAPPRHHERQLGCDRPSERQHVELRLPARHQVASLTLAKKHAPPHKAAGTTFLIEPLRPIPPGACAGAHGTNTRTAPWPPNLPTTSLAFGGAARRS